MRRDTKGRRGEVCVCVCLDAEVQEAASRSPSSCVRLRVVSDPRQSLVSRWGGQTTPGPLRYLPADKDRARILIAGISITGPPGDR